MSGAPAGGDGSALARLLPTASPRATLRRIRAELSRRRGLAAATAAALAGAATTSALVPPLIGALVDTVLRDGSAGRVDLLVLLLLVTGLVGALLSGVGSVLVARLGESVLADLREDVVVRALDVPQERLERAGTGDLVARVGGDQEAVADAVQEALPALLRSVLAVVLTVAGLAVLDLRLALAGLLAVPVQVAATRWYLRRARPLYAAERVSLGARTQVLGDALRGRRTVQALRRESVTAERVRRADREAVDRGLRAARTGSTFGALLNGAELLGLAAVLAAGWLLVDAGAATVGEATAAALFFARLFDPVMELLYLLDTAQDAGAAAARLVGVADLPARPAAPPELAPPTPVEVRLSGVRFAYVQGEPGGTPVEVLRGVDLVLPAGTRTALVGRSGAGKSTLAGVLAGVHEAHGQVLVDGEACGTDRLRSRVALVTQEVHVFAGSLADDLRLARPDATDEELHAALAAVGATWATALPAGLRTPVGETGTHLDSTRGQQLALARLLLHPAPVVVLDEATAEAGSAGARELESAAVAAARGRTSLVVAHRLSVAATADRVVVLDEGRVVEQGTHEQLRRAGGTYAALWAAWSAPRDRTAARLDG